MTDREEPGRASLPTEEPPHERGRGPAWALGGMGGVVALGFLAVVLLVLVLVLL